MKPRAVKRALVIAVVLLACLFAALTLGRSILAQSGDDILSGMAKSAGLFNMVLSVTTVGSSNKIADSIWIAW
jgi:hypothetical protein